MVAVHGVLDVIAGDKEVAVKIGDGDIGDDKAVAVVMEDQTAADFVARGGLMFGKLFGERGCSRLWPGSRLLGAGGFGEQEAVVGKLLDEAAFLEFGKHLEEGAADGFLDLEGTGKVFEGDGAVSKLKKTQDIIRT
ncbi:MAG TPA: hypothetical protein VKB48_10060 [Candidatus Acidoferrum sp.]|nr:hypothetical protein [Candidatus Acidoferrum sp.]